MHTYHSEANQQHGIPLHILQRQPVPTQRAGLYEIPCSCDKIYIRQTSCHISTMAFLHITYIGLKSQSSVVLHTLWRQNAARTSSEQKSKPIHRPTNHVSPRKPQKYANILKTSNRGIDRDYVQPGTTSSPPTLNPDTPYPIL